MPEHTKPVLVIDTNILISAMRDPTDTPARQPFQHVQDDKAVMLLSFTLWNEYQKGAWHPTTLSVRSVEYIEQRLKQIANKAHYFERPPHQVEMPRHRKDEHLLNLAVYKDADFLITREKRILALDANEAWRQWYPSMKVVLPEAFQHERSLWQERQHRLEHERLPSISW
jgi:putative PIN family toxin of toxin-antitoxin system